MSANTPSLEEIAELIGTAAAEYSSESDASTWDEALDALGELEELLTSDELGTVFDLVADLVLPDYGDNRITRVPRPQGGTVSLSSTS